MIAAVAAAYPEENDAERRFPCKKISENRRSAATSAEILIDDGFTKARFTRAGSTPGNSRQHRRLAADFGTRAYEVVSGSTRRSARHES
jgi:hypothetical protein